MAIDFFFFYLDFFCQFYLSFQPNMYLKALSIISITLQKKSSSILLLYSMHFNMIHKHTQVFNLWYFFPLFPFFSSFFSKLFARIFYIFYNIFTFLDYVKWFFFSSPLSLFLSSYYYIMIYNSHTNYFSKILYWFWIDFFISSSF